MAKHTKTLAVKLAETRTDRRQPTWIDRLDADTKAQLFELRRKWHADGLAGPDGLPKTKAQVYRFLVKEIGVPVKQHHFGRWLSEEDCGQEET